MASDDVMVGKVCLAGRAAVVRSGGFEAQTLKGQGKKLPGTPSCSHFDKKFSGSVAAFERSPM
jgi:hypothetical protein